MSGECDYCSEHCLDCECNKENMNNLVEIRIWAQMFFEDGTVSQGVRIPAQWLEDEFRDMLRLTVQNLAKSLNREDGWFLLWGAGNIQFGHYPSAFSNSLESDS